MSLIMFPSSKTLKCIPLCMYRFPLCCYCPRPPSISGLSRCPTVRGLVSPRDSKYYLSGGIKPEAVVRCKSACKVLPGPPLWKWEDCPVGAWLGYRRPTHMPQQLLLPLLNLLYESVSNLCRRINYRLVTFKRYRLESKIAYPNFAGCRWTLFGEIDVRIAIISIFAILRNHSLWGDVDRKWSHQSKVWSTCHIGTQMKVRSICHSYQFVGNNRLGRRRRLTPEMTTPIDVTTS
jgi:hypothetical protein